MQFSSTSNETISIDFESFDTTETIKLKIYDKLGVRFDNIRFFY